MKLKTISIAAIVLAALALGLGYRPDVPAPIAEPEAKPKAATTVPLPVGKVTEREDPALPADEPGSGFENLAPGLVRPLLIEAVIPEPGQSIELPIGDPPFPVYQVAGHFRHDNGDISIHAHGEGLHQRATLTWGDQGLFARIGSDQGLHLVHSDASGSWLIDLNDEGLEVDNFHGDTLGQAILHPLAASALERQQSDATAGLRAPAGTSQTSSSIHQIDVMFIYTPDMLERYPGSLIDTRLNHLLAIANQAMADSEVPIVVRLVHHRQIPYPAQAENRMTLFQLRDAMRGEAVPAFEGVREARDQFGADIVALTWPHDIETRGSCGVAFFPNQMANGSFDASHGVHIDNDGASNWSICSDAVFTHELGHNLNAEHQRSQSSGDDPARSNYAFVAPNRFHTVMGSFGTGDVNRYLRLDVFSNPRIQCGGQPCGSTQPGQGADNAAAVNQLAPIVAAYRAPTQPGQLTPPPRSNPDSDGDGVSDWDDPFPFDPFDGDPPEPTDPPFVFSPRTLSEGSQDQDWELLVISAGSDQVLAFSPDGQFRSVVTAPEPKHPGPILTEFSDMDIDNEGRLYLLANGDVRRFDRLSGELIDIYLDATRPEPAELQSPFPRALGFGPANQLIVLGDNAIERYDAQRQRLNFPQTGDLRPSPANWNDLLAFSPRAFAVHQSRFHMVDSGTPRILRFDVTTGFRLNDLAGPDNPWVEDPWDLAFDQAGLLYLANGQAGNVLRFDPDTNSFVDEFIPAGSQGLAFARALAFGPDGDLYVACRESSHILRFDGQTGAARGVVAEAGQGGLSEPSSLLFARRLDEVHRGHSGHFIDLERGGEGWLFEVLDRERVSMSWFTYPPGAETADQAWMVGVGEIQGNRVEFDEVLFTEGSGFGIDFDPASLVLVPWGEIQLEFHNCDSATLSYQGPPDWGQAERRLTRLIRIPGLPCGSQALNAEPDRPGISGQWFNRELSGQGWFLQEIEPDRVFLAGYSYDSDGQQLWLVGDSGRFEGRELVFEDILISRGTRFGDEFESEDVELLPWGSVRFEFDSCDTALVHYQSDLPGFGSGTLPNVRLTGLEDLDCALP